MSRFIGICLTMGLLCLLSSARPAEADSTRTNYQIKGRPVHDFVDALEQLHKFLSPKFTREQRCQRQAVALTQVKRGKTTQFQINDIALMRGEDIEKKYNEINVELLRNLYINASRQYLEKKRVSVSLVELLDCLRAGFRNRDAKARSFLNEVGLKTVIEQFDAISKQPLKVLVDGDGHNIMGLNWQQLDESLRHSISSWVGEDQQKLKKLFKKEDKPSKQEEPKRESHGNQDVGAQAAASAMITGPEQTQMDEEEQEYLETLFGSLIAVFESMPEQAELGDRCHAYNRVIQAEKEQILQDEFLDNLVSEVSNNVKQDVKQGDFTPDEKTREDFLFIVDTFDPLRAGPEAWLDLNECLSKWVNEDENVVRYLENPEHVQLVNQLTSQLYTENAQAYAQSSPGAEVPQ